ncbi:XRE family transcriptional regulator [Pseudomonas sp. MIL19]|uniref:helix-turn-helix domain-containing protein n=1 Tax=Pseudomonas sp. MIL19 TaxID=2976979 RepID=UPI0023641BB1|nr:XRE family transcriptional regulator [Pseudomonas sp. MIL19]MDD2162541.1 XRE family transcriptional regulator [Pseudomonas sp. MIL19]
MKPLNTDSLAGRIALARRARNLTQAELAKRAGMTQSSIALLENATTAASHSSLAIAQALQVPVEWLLNGGDLEATLAAQTTEASGSNLGSGSVQTLPMLNRPLNTFSQRLIFRREQCGLTQAQLAKKSGLSQATIGNLETGRNKGTKKILELANALNITPEWLANGGDLSLANATALRRGLGILSKEEQREHDMKRLLSMATLMPEQETAQVETPAAPIVQPLQMLPIISWLDPALKTPQDTYLSSSAEGHFRTPFEQSKQAFWMRVSFDVMEPEYLENDLILVDPTVSPQSTDDIVILDAQGRPGFGRLSKTLSGQYIETLNPKYPDRMHPIEDATLIVGTVIASIRQRRAKA